MFPEKSMDMIKGVLIRVEDREKEMLHCYGLGLDHKGPRATLVGRT
jgi:hypothetical protein